MVSSFAHRVDIPPSTGLGARTTCTPLLLSETQKRRQSLPAHVSRLVVFRSHRCFLFLILKSSSKFFPFFPQIGCSFAKESKKCWEHASERWNLVRKWKGFARWEIASLKRVEWKEVWEDLDGWIWLDHGSDGVSGRVPVRLNVELVILWFLLTCNNNIYNYNNYCYTVHLNFDL